MGLRPWPSLGMKSKRSNGLETDVSSRRKKLRVVASTRYMYGVFLLFSSVLVLRTTMAVTMLSTHAQKSREPFCPAQKAVTL